MGRLRNSARRFFGQATGEVGASLSAEQALRQREENGAITNRNQLQTRLDTWWRAFSGCSYENKTTPRRMKSKYSFTFEGLVKGNAVLGCFAYEFLNICLFTTAIRRRLNNLNLAHRGIKW